MANGEFSIIIVSVLFSVVLAWGTWLPLSAGQLSLGSLVPFGSGAYATFLARQHGHDIWLALALGALAGLIGGVALWLMSLRLSGFALALATFSLFEVLIVIVGRIDYLGALAGLSGAPALSHPFAASVALVCACLVASWVLEHSRFGLQKAMVRREPLQARALGIDARRVSLVCFTVSGVLLGVGGGMFGLYGAYVSPSLFSLGLLVEAFTLASIGGLQSWAAPFVGGGVLALLVQYSGVAGSMQPIVYGGIIIVVVVLRPEGVVPRLHRLARRRATRLILRAEQAAQATIRPIAEKG